MGDRGVLIGKATEGIRLIRTAKANVVGIPTLVQLTWPDLQGSWSYEVSYDGFADELRELHRRLQGTARASAIEGLQLTVTAGTLGAVGVTLEISRLELELKASFGIDQSFLPDIIRGVEREFPPPYFAPTRRNPS